MAKMTFGEILDEVRKAFPDVDEEEVRNLLNQEILRLSREYGGRIRTKTFVSLEASKSPWWPDLAGLAQLYRHSIERPITCWF